MKKTYLTDEQYKYALNEIDCFQVSLDAVDFRPDLFTGYERIAVVGPQRSGTTFTGQALADALAFNSVDESAFGVRDKQRFAKIWQNRNIVVQAPAMTHCIHTVAGPNDLVVFMTRKWSDILKSVKRKNGRLSTNILSRVSVPMDRVPFLEADPETQQTYDRVNNPSTYYNMWKHYQRKKIPNAIALNYESMNQHPMWKDKDLRANFTAKQTK